jgi:hypothetical protein
MTNAELNTVEQLVNSGWNYKQAIKFVLTGTPRGHARMYSKATTTKINAAVRAYERKNGK